MSELSVKIQEGNDDSDENKSGKWTQNQNLKYVLFLSKHRVKFEAKLKKRKIRLFQQMSIFITTRSPIQCRTHHQKYLDKFGSCKSIINIYKQEIGVDSFKHQMKEHFKQQHHTSNELPELKIQKKIQQLEEIEKPERKEIGIQTDFPYEWIHYHSLNMQHWQGANYYDYPPPNP